MNKNSDYSHYFKNHYKLSYNAKTLATYRKWFYRQWKEILKHVEIKKNQDVLEIGSGIGTLYSFLKDMGVTKYKGLELDRDAVRFSNRYYTGKLFYNKRFEKFEIQQFLDYVFAFEVLEHLDDPDREIEKVYKILKKNGYFIGTSPYPFAKNIYADETHKYVLHPAGWKEMFEKHMFSKVDTYPMSFFPFVWRISGRLNFLIPVYLPFKNIISTTLIIAQK